ncbi:probable calcium-binding protein CML45 [Sesamum indicum]|uniref:Probable calcium-binding protein CML45 n=1 Tax=Sesamum indicum TaxID=4182 RepID=A0A6I9UL25_SESIN|nr:probable calcium-binding protein CML45 [Sesamum indicum]
MSLTGLNQFPVHETVSLNLNSIQLTVLIVGLVKFLLLRILLDRKRISCFVSRFQSQLLSNDDYLKTRAVSTKDGDSQSSTASNQEKRVDDQSVCRGEVEMILRSLGMLCGDVDQAGAKLIPASLDANDLLNMFEERTPSLDEVKEAFDVFDSNRDGFIDAQELQKVLSALGLKEGSEMENCRRMIGAFDENGDGRIDLDEFIKFMENSSS